MSTFDPWSKCLVVGGLQNAISKFIIIHSMRLSLIRRQELKDAKWDLMNLIRHDERDGTTVEIRNQIKQAQSVVDNLNEKFLEGAKIRSKAKYLENNEKPTRFFLQKENKSANDTLSKQLKSGLKIALYIAEVKRKTINCNSV